jgi:cytochrome c553
MKSIRLKKAVLGVVISAAFSTLPALVGAAGAVKFENCIWCHGESGQGYATAPRLAGQRPQYIENQLLSFLNHTRDGPFARQYMWGAAAALSPQAARGYATFFSMLPAKAANDGDKELAVTGRTIYQEGIPDSNIVACAPCHGPNAEGVREIPRLGGLSYYNLKTTLEQWGRGYDAAAEPPMPRVAGKLSPIEIEAIASYLSYVK